MCMQRKATSVDAIKVSLYVCVCMKVALYVYAGFVCVLRCLCMCMKVALYVY